MWKRDDPAKQQGGAPLIGTAPFPATLPSTPGAEERQKVEPDLSDFDAETTPVAPVPAVPIAEDQLSGARGTSRASAAQPVPFSRVLGIWRRREQWFRSEMEEAEELIDEIEKTNFPGMFSPSVKEGVLAKLMEEREELIRQLGHYRARTEDFSKGIEELVNFARALRNDAPPSSNGK